MLRKKSSLKEKEAETTDRRFLLSWSIISLERNIIARQKAYYAKKSSENFFSWKAAVNSLKRYVELDLKYNQNKSYSQMDCLTSKFLNEQMLTLRDEAYQANSTLDTSKPSSPLVERASTSSLTNGPSLLTQQLSLIPKSYTPPASTLSSSSDEDSDKLVLKTGSPSNSNGSDYLKKENLLTSASDEKASQANILTTVPSQSDLTQHASTPPISIVSALPSLLSQSNTSLLTLQLLEAAENRQLAEQKNSIAAKKAEISAALYDTDTTVVESVSDTKVTSLESTPEIPKKKSWFNIFCCTGLCSSAKPAKSDMERNPDTFGPAAQKM